MINSWYKSNKALFTSSHENAYSFLVDNLVSSDDIDLLDSNCEIILPYSINLKNKKHYKRSVSKIVKESDVSDLLISPRSDEVSDCSKDRNQSHTITAYQVLDSLEPQKTKSFFGSFSFDGIRINKFKIRYYLNTFECFLKESEQGVIELDKISFSNNELLDIFYLNKNKGKIKKQLEQKIINLLAQYNGQSSHVENLIDL